MDSAEEDGKISAQVGTCSELVCTLNLGYYKLVVMQNNRRKPSNTSANQLPAFPAIVVSWSEKLCGLCNVWDLFSCHESGQERHQSSQNVVQGLRYGT